MQIQQITPQQLKARLDAGDDLFLLDVCEPNEREICNIDGELIPKDTVVNNLDRLPRDKEIVVYCRSGGRSQWVAEQLKVRGFERLSNLAGGMLRWSDDVVRRCGSTSLGPLPAYPALSNLNKPLRHHRREQLHSSAAAYSARWSVKLSTR